MKPILCVTDLSGSAVQVLEVAARMAYAYRSYLTILFAMNEVNPLTLQSLITNSRLPFTIVPEEIDTEVFSGPVNK